MRISSVNTNLVKNMFNGERLADCWNACFNFENPQRDIETIRKSLLALAIGFEQLKVMPLIPSLLDKTLISLGKTLGEALSLYREE